MKDQHKKITGYRELTKEEIDLMNLVKQKGVELDQIINNLFSNESTDKRWIVIGQTDLQTGLMALVRSIAKPDSF